MHFKCHSLIVWVAYFSLTDDIPTKPGNITQHVLYFPLCPKYHKEDFYPAGQHVHARTIWELSIVLQRSNRDRMRHTPWWDRLHIHYTNLQSLMSCQVVKINHYICFYSKASLTVLFFLQLIILHLFMWLISYSPVPRPNPLGVSGLQPRQSKSVQLEEKIHIFTWNHGGFTLTFIPSQFLSKCESQLYGRHKALRRY